MSKTEDDKEIHTAEIERSLASVADAWGSDAPFSVDEMCEHLEQVIAVVVGDNSFNEFIKNTGFKDIKDS